MYNCPTRWYTVVDEMSVDELSWNLLLYVWLGHLSNVVKYVRLFSCNKRVFTRKNESNKKYSEHKWISSNHSVCYMHS